jgi:hypothetical protein
MQSQPSALGAAELLPAGSTKHRPFSIFLFDRADVLMRRFFLLLMIASTSSAEVVVLDRMAVIVGKHVIKTSDIAWDSRVTEFLNRQPLNFSPTAKRQSAERLIDQEIIRQEIVTGNYRRPPDSDAAALLNNLRRDRFGGSDVRMREELQRYGITEDQLRAQLLWQLTVLRFIDQRFRPAVIVSDEEVHTYYDQHLADLRRQYPDGSSFEALESKIRSLLEGQRINESFTQWLEEARKRARIEYRQEAFQ